MQKVRPARVAKAGADAPRHDKNSLNEMLQELRILLQGAQLLTAFLIVLPFTDRFAAIIRAEKIIFVVTFLCSLLSLVVFSLPAVHHRMQRPLLDRARFKDFSTRMMLIGLAPLTIALTLSTQLAVSEVIGEVAGTVVSIGVFLVIVVLWWLLPLLQKRRK